MNEQFHQAWKKKSYNMSYGIKSDDANKTEKAIYHYELALEGEQEMMPFFTDEEQKKNSIECQRLFSSRIKTLKSRLAQ